MASENGIWYTLFFALVSIVYRPKVLFSQLIASWCCLKLLLHFVCICWELSFWQIHKTFPLIRWADPETLQAGIRWKLQFARTQFLRAQWMRGNGELLLLEIIIKCQIAFSTIYFFQVFEIIRTANIVSIFMVYYHLELILSAWIRRRGSERK